MAGRRRTNSTDSNRIKTKSFLTTPSVYHALIVIFLEFFAFGLLTAPMITVLDEAFPKHTFLMNGLIQGVKGFLSFLSAPLIGAMSDVFGRKPFLFLTVTFTCSPIPLMKISHWWYFTMVSISGIFSVTFSVIFAYVADVTTEEDRTYAYGLVSATFAASLITSPAIGAYLGRFYSDNFVVALASAVALLDVFFILAFVPESLPDRCRPTGVGSKFSWEKADPFRALKRIGADHLILMLCITVFLSFLPEAGEYSCFFVYLRLVMGFTENNVAYFIAVVGILSCLSQTIVLSVLMRHFGHKPAIIFGLVCEMIQLACYGFGSKAWIMWLAGCIAGIGSLTYPAISAFVSNHAEPDQQGVAQGVVTGIRGLCNGLGPALFGCIFYLFQVDLSTAQSGAASDAIQTTMQPNVSVPLISNLHNIHETLLPGPPFAFGAILVFFALLVAMLIPNPPPSHTPPPPPTSTPYLGSPAATGPSSDCEMGGTLGRSRARIPSASAVAALLSAEERRLGRDGEYCSDDDITVTKVLVEDLGGGGERRKHVKTSSMSSNELINGDLSPSVLVAQGSPSHHFTSSTAPGSRGVLYSRLPTNDLEDNET